MSKLTTDCPRPHEEGAAGAHPTARHPALEPEGPDRARDGHQGGDITACLDSTDVQFFSKSASSSPKKAKPARSPAPELDLSQIDEAAEASSPASTHANAPDDAPGDAVDTDPSPSNPGPLCPICQRALGPETSNAQLNEHIDLCLNRGVEGVEASPVKRRAETPTPTPTQTQGRRKKKRKEGPTVLDWLKRGA